MLFYFSFHSFASFIIFHSLANTLLVKTIMLPTTTTTVENYENRVSSYTDWAFGSEAPEALKARKVFFDQIILRHHTNDENLNIFDVGCGPGRDMREFISQGENIFVTGLEPSPSFCKVANEILGKQFHVNRFNIVQGDVCDDFVVRVLVDRADASTLFHGAFCLSSLFHIPGSQLPTALRNIHSVLRPGGVAFTTFPLNRMVTDRSDGAWSSGSTSDGALRINEGSAGPDGRWCTALTSQEHRQLLEASGFRPVDEVVIRIYNGLWTGIVSEKV